MGVRFYWTESGRDAFARLCRDHQAELLDRIYGKLRCLKRLIKGHPEISCSPAIFCVGDECFVLCRDAEDLCWYLEGAVDPEDGDSAPAPVADNRKRKRGAERTAMQEARRARRRSRDKSGAIERRVSMMRMFSDDGAHVPVTVLSLQDLANARATATYDEFSSRSETTNSIVVGAQTLVGRAAELVGGVLNNIIYVVTLGLSRSGKSIWADYATRSLSSRDRIPGGLRRDGLLFTWRKRTTEDEAFDTLRARMLVQHNRIEAHLRQMQLELREARIAAERAVASLMAQATDGAWQPTDVPRGGVLDPQPEPGAQNGVVHPCGESAGPEQLEPQRRQNSSEESYFDALFTGHPRIYRGTSRPRIDASQDETV